MRTDRKQRVERAPKAVVRTHRHFAACAHHLSIFVGPLVDHSAQLRPIRAQEIITMVPSDGQKAENWHRRKRR